MSEDKEENIKQIPEYMIKGLLELGFVQKEGFPELFISTKNERILYYNGEGFNVIA